jgi:Ca2+/Na+ antiporter
MELERPPRGSLSYCANGGCAMFVPFWVIVAIVILVIIYRYQTSKEDEKAAEREATKDEWSERKADLDAQIEAVKNRGREKVGR